MFEVYLISRVQWAPIMCGVAVEPCAPFKIGYSRNPPGRLEQLRTGVPFNLMLVGVVAGFHSADEAEMAEAVLLMEARREFTSGRGEWFDGDPLAAWAKVFEPAGGLLLNTKMTVDLDRVPVVPFPPGHWSAEGARLGTSDAFHGYLAERKAREGAPAAAGADGLVCPPAPQGLPPAGLPS